MPNTVWVVDKDDAAKALPTPAFIVKKGGVYYLTLAVWEYSAARAEQNDDQDQRDGCAGMKNEFDALVAEGPTYTAVQRPPGGSGGGEHTNPPSDS